MGAAMSAGMMLLKSVGRLSRTRSVSLAKAQAWWGEFAKILRVLRGPFESYRPEAYYMRGPGPKWRQKHRLPGSEIRSRPTPNE